MAQEPGKILGQVNLTTVNNTAIYTAAGKSSTADAPVWAEAWVFVCCEQATTAAYRLFLIPSGGSAGSATKLAWDVDLKDKWGTHRYGPLFLQEGDAIHARSDTANVIVVTVVGREVEFDQEFIGAPVGGL